MVEGKTTEVSKDVVDAVVGIFNDSKMDDATKA